MSNDLVILQDDKPMTTSLKVAEVFGKNHQHVLRDIDNLIERGVSNLGQTLYTHPQNGQQYRMFIMDRDGFTLLVMGFTGAKALEWQRKYIAAFNAMEKELKERSLAALPDFTNPVEAARAWADEVEAAQRAKARAIAAEEAKALVEAQVVEMKPKVDFVDEFVETEQGHYTPTQAAKILHVPPKKFTRYLRDSGLCLKKGRLEASAEYLTRGWFIHKADLAPSGYAYTQLYVTPRGLEALAGRVVHLMDKPDTSPRFGSK